LLGAATFLSQSFRSSTFAAAPHARSGEFVYSG